MPDGRMFDSGMATVTVGLLHGGSESGTIKAFQPEAPDLTLSTTTRNAQGTIEERTLTLVTSKVSYVAFYRETVVVPEVDPERAVELNVYTPGGNRFAVVVDTELLEDPIGFYGQPISQVSLYGELFFFAHGINAKEDRTPLGSMLVQEGMLQSDDLQRSFAAQTANRSSRIGDILVEQGRAGATEVEKAAGSQRTRKAGGKPVRLGEILVEAGLATPKDIDTALQEQKGRRGKRLGEVLVEMGIVSETVIAETLAKKFHVPFIDLDDCQIDEHAVDEVATGLIERYRILPFQTDETSLSIAIADPLGVEAMDMLRFSINKRLIEVMVLPSQLDEYMEPYLAGLEAADELESDLQTLLLEGFGAQKSRDESDEIAGQAEDEGVAKLAYRLILMGRKLGASDIHIEPQGHEEPLVVRFRIDGRCVQHRNLPAKYRASLVARIKIMANLDITERRKPQDGKIKLRLARREAIELRVATLPTVTGDEDVVMRILASGKPMQVEDLALTPRNLTELRRAVAQPYGLLLVVGPTGSGKTTTLHSMLSLINTVDRKIWTAEDPVEITQLGLRQVQVHPRIGFDFATAMRSFLRADPDVIMVGEMRDEETASTGVEASLTGHLVLSTLHTNSAPETITRLLDMGLDPFTFSDALIAVLAQRLVRRLCPECREAYEPSDEERAQVTDLYGEQALEELLGGDPLKLWRSLGCELCENTGYRGRMGVHEMLVNTDEIRVAVQKRAPAMDIRELSVGGGMTTLMQDGLRKCIRGRTDLKQVLTVCSR